MHNSDKNDYPIKKYFRKGKCKIMSDSDIMQKINPELNLSQVLDVLWFCSRFFLSI